MAATKKRTKKYRVRPVNIPMMFESRNRLALELHLAIDTLIRAPSPGSYNELTKMVTAINRTGMGGAGLELITATLTAICDRFERVEKVGVSVSEAEQLRQAGADLDWMLAKIPINRLMAEVAAVLHHSKELGI